MRGRVLSQLCGYETSSLSLLSCFCRYPQSLINNNNKITNGGELVGDPVLDRIYNKHYGNNKNNNKKGEIEMAIKTKNGIKNEKKETAKREKQYRFKTMTKGTIRLSGVHMSRFGFKPKQELEIVNTKPGEITIKVKNGAVKKEETPIAAK
jgi:hypothetical protein